MKFKKFLKAVIEILLYNFYIDDYTIKIIFKEFEHCLSYKELNKYSYLVKQIEKFSQKQLNIDQVNKDLIIKDLEKKFIELSK